MGDSVESNKQFYFIFLVFLDVSDEFWIQIWEAVEFILIQIHHEQFVRWRQIGFLRCELFVEVRHIFAMFLQIVINHFCQSQERYDKLNMPRME